MLLLLRMEGGIVIVGPVNFVAFTTQFELLIVAADELGEC